MRDVVLISSEEDKVMVEEMSPPPRMSLRVLLVESDDSTRRIISALLRKCSYRVVAVPDGLMAWETLKDQPQNIDLILTELDLPSITGFALLALIMEHESCKNIPVIMMSTQDSVSMVLKCMLKGAADFLIKPVRKNELKNLWQHVWRRHTLNAGIVHQSSPVLQPKLEATSENNSAVNQSEREPAIARDGMQETSDEFGTGEGKVRDEEKHRDETRSYRNNSEEFKSSSVTMNLIGAFDNRPESFSRSCCSNESTSPELELSLRRVLSGDLRSQEANKKPKLCHSNASAFARYENGKSWQPAFPAVAATAANSSEPHTPSKSHETPNELYRDTTVNSDIQGATTSTNEENIASSVSEQSAKIESSYQSSDGDITVQPTPHGSGTNKTQHKQESENEICEFQGTVNRSNEHERATNVIGQCTSSYTCADGTGGLKEEIAVSHDGFKGMDAQRSSQREAALLKFRLKRKDRCFEKKVRYQSRKKLAEQRPRVKGQFVRAVQTVSQAPDASVDT